MALPALPVTERKFPRAVIGDFTFIDYSSSRRIQPLLLRNIRKILVHHGDKILCNNSINFPTPRQQHSSGSVEIFADEPSPVGTAEDQAKPVLEAASHKALVIRTMDPNFENTSRRSVRRLQEAAYHNDDAELTLDLVSIRKKLNFTTNRITEERPRKKTKSGHIKCLCSLTIWDNRTGTAEKDVEKDPLVKQHVNCTIVTFETEDRVPNVNIQLDEPFKLKAKDLKVPLKTKGLSETILGIGDDYFVELKLFPTKADADWPPIPVLGKSDGDSQRGLTILSAERLKGALLARYQKLPQAPEPNVPLSVFFIVDGRVHKTKFGLELNAQWSVPNTTLEQHTPEVAAKLPGSSWTVDSSGTPFGRKRAVLANRTKKESLLPPTPNGVAAAPADDPRKTVKVSYVVDPDSMKASSIAKELRTVEVNDFKCPVCVSFTAKDVLELRFHLVMMHSKYNFVLANDNDGRNVRKLLFNIVPIQSGKPSQRGRNEKEFEYFANRAPFNVSRFLDGDESWTGETRPRARVQQAAASGRPLLEDPASSLRKQNGGHLAPKDVRDFRKPERRKHRVVPLDRKHDDKRTPYSSISHRPRSISEDAMSETDDEIDDEWFVERHLENLDNISKKERWSELKTEVVRRWNKHRLEEKLDHPRFMSDSLVRFVRKEKEMLRSQDAGMQAAISDLLTDLVRSRYITIQFCADIRAMIYNNGEGSQQNRDVAMADAPVLTKSKPPTVLNPRVLEQQVSGWATGQAFIPVNIWKKHVLALPKSSCGVCTKTIVRPHKMAIHCSNHDCPVAGAAFHLKCVKQQQREKDWTCHGCKVLRKTDKGKGRAVD